MKRSVVFILCTLLILTTQGQIGVFQQRLLSDSSFSKDYRFRNLPSYSIYNALMSVTAGDQNLAAPPGTTAQRPIVPSGKVIIRFNSDSNALEYGNSSQVWRTLSTGSVQTFDTSSIPNYSVKTRSLMSSSNPLQYNAITGNMTILQSSGSQPGYLSQADWLSFNARLPDPGSNGIVSRTASGTVVSRQLMAASPNVSVVNANGVSGNPSIDLNDTLTLNQLKLPNIPPAASSADSALYLNRSTGNLETRPITPVAAPIETQQSVVGNGTSLNKARLVGDLSATPSTGEEYQYGFDSTGQRGFIKNKYVIAKKFSELRSLRTADTATIYRTITSSIVADFYWDPSSTAIDDSVMVIKLAGITTGRLLRYFDNYVLVDWFGAKADDGLDDSYAIQKAIDFALASPRIPEVRFLGGIYNASNINIAKKSGSEYTFVTLSLKGHSLLAGQATSISVDNVDGFGFHIMKGREIKIEDITFLGQGPTPVGSQALTWTESQWTTGVRNNRYSPHAGIVIDGYHSSVTSLNQYPGMSGFYTNSSTGGTSMVTLRNCGFKKFAAAIIEGAAGAVQNGDNIKASDCYFEYNNVAWACGQTQSRANTIENCYFLIHRRIVDGITYGSQQGTPPNVVRSNFAGVTKYLYAINGAFSGMTWQECYSEGTFSLGRSVSGSVQFTDCEIMMSPGDIGFSTPRAAEGDIVSFKGGRFGYFDNISNMAIPFAVKNLSFDGVTLLCLPTNLNPTVFDVLLNKTVFNNCRFIGANQLGDTWGANTYNKIEHTNVFNNTTIVMPGTKYIYEHPDYQTLYESKSPKIETYSTETKTLKINTGAITAYFLSSTPSIYRVNDVLLISNTVSWTGDESLYASGPTVLGEVTGISVDTVKLKYVPYGVDESTSYDILIARIPHYLPKFYGDITNGSNSVVNAKFGIIQPVIGDWVKATGVPTATRITNIVGTTITLSRNATATATTTEFGDAKVYTESKTGDIALVNQGMGFSVGDIVVNDRTLPQYDSIAYWICKTSGFVGSPPSADFTYVKTGSSGGGGGLGDITKVHDSVFANSYAPSNYRFRDSVRWGIDTTTITQYSSANKRNDAGTTIRLASGRLLTGYSAFQSASGDNDSSNIVSKYSDDNGKTWRGLDTIVLNTGLNSFIPSFYFSPAKDTLRMLFVRSLDASNNQIYGTYSVDFNSDNPSWSTPALVFGNTTSSFSPASDRVFKTKAGIYLYPLAMHIDGELTSSTGRYDGFVMKSTNGVTWDTIPGARIISPDTLFVEGGFIQTEDANKTVTYYGRTRSGQLYISNSIDGGTTWDLVYPWGLYCNNSTTTVKYIEELRTVVSAGNRYDGTGTINGVGGRVALDVSIRKLPLRNVNLAIPQDATGGQWQFLMRIDSATNRQFIEPWLTVSDNELLVTYSDGDYATGDTFNLKVKRIPLPYLTTTANVYSQQLVLNKTFTGVDANMIEMYSNGLDPTKAYAKFRNLSSGNTSFGLWLDVGTIGQQNGLYFTPHGSAFDGAFWINPDNNGAAIINGASIFRATNNGSERFNLFGDGSQRYYNSGGEYARWFGGTGNLTINTGGTDNGQKLQVNGTVRLDNVPATPGSYNLMAHRLGSDSSLYQVGVGNLLTTAGNSVQVDPTIMAPGGNNTLLLKGRIEHLSYTVPDADFTTLATRQEGLFYLPDITADRTFSMFGASGVDGQELFIYNANTSGSFHWAFSGTAVKKSSDGSTVTTMTNGVLYHIMGTYVNSTPLWIVINQ